MTDDELAPRLARLSALYGPPTRFSVTDAREAYVLFESMRTPELLDLQVAHQADLMDATKPESIAFGAGRLALIAAVLKARDDSVPFRGRPAADQELVLAMRAAVANGAGHECEEWTANGQCQLCGRPLVVRLRYRRRGAHVHCRLFTAPAFNHIFALVGELTFTAAEWPLLMNLLAPAGVQFVVEEGGTDG